MDRARVSSLNKTATPTGKRDSACVDAIWTRRLESRMLPWYRCRSFSRIANVGDREYWEANQT